MLKSLLPKWLLSVLIHALVGGAALGLVYWQATDERILSQSVLTRLADNPAAIQQLLEDTRAALLLAAGLSFGASFLASGLWLFIAERSMPIDNAGARSQTASWCGLLLFSLTLAAVLWWSNIWLPLVSQNIAPGVLAKTTPGVLAAAALAYYLATGMLVKNAVRASVPLAPLLFRF